MENEIVVGTVYAAPHDVESAIDALVETFGAQRKNITLMGLAGPNEAIHLILTAQLWGMSLPWALKAVTGGALAAAGGKLFRKLVKSSDEARPRGQRLTW